MNLKKVFWNNIVKLSWVIIIIILVFLAKTVNEIGVDYIENQKDRINGVMIEAEPVLAENGDIGVLMIHGFSSSPKDFKELAEFLTKKNITVSIPLLPGHGTHPKDLKEIVYEDWKDHISLSLSKLDTKKKFILGFSMGGALALDSASKNNLDGIISINSAIFIQNKYLPFIPFITFVETYTSKKPEDIVYFSNEKRVVYDSVPLTSILELKKLIDSLSINKITEPILILQSDNDEVISPESAFYIYNTIQSKDKKLIILNNSTHSRLNNQEKAFEEIYQFIASH